MKRLLSLLLIVTFCICCGKKEKKQEGPRVIPVEKAVAIKKDTPEFIDAIGHVDPLTTIEIRPRVSGEILKIHFKEGDEVKQNELLFTLDSRPFEANLSRNMAMLSENEANMRQAEEKLSRYSALIKQDYISPLDFHDLQTQVATTQSMIEQNQAEIKQQELNIEYCHIFSPVEGVTGILNIDEGNMVFTNNTTPLVSILQIRPIYVLFSVGEKHLDKIRAYQKQNRLEVQATMTDFMTESERGFLDILDNTVNTGTGMIRLRGIFANEEKVLWPGTYVKTRLILTIHKDAILVPFEAIQYTEEGPVVFVIQNGNKVDQRPVTLGQRLDGNIVIQTGVKEGDEVVTKGRINLYPGAPVTVSTQKSEAKS